MSGRPMSLVVAVAVLLLVVVPTFAPLQAAAQLDGSLDVVLGELPPGFFEDVEGAPRHGALVVEVLTGGAGDRKGLLEGDLIIEFEGEPVTSAFELAGRIRREGEGSLVSITVWRDGSRTWLGIARLSGRVPPVDLAGEVTALRDEVADLRDEVEALRQDLAARP